MGRKNRPFYRIGAYDNRTRRDGRTVEALGTYDPLNAKPEEQVKLKEERIRYWLSQGAQPSETVASMLKKAGIELRPKKGWVECSFKLGRRMKHPRVRRIVQASANRIVHFVRLDGSDALDDELREWLAEAYLDAPS